MTENKMISISRFKILSHCIINRFVVFWSLMGLKIVALQLKPASLDHIPRLIGT